MEFQSYRRASVARHGHDGGHRQSENDDGVADEEDAAGLFPLQNVDTLRKRTRSKTLPPNRFAPWTYHHGAVDADVNDDVGDQDVEQPVADFGRAHVDRQEHAGH